MEREACHQGPGPKSRRESCAGTCCTTTPMSQLVTCDQLIVLYRLPVPAGHKSEETPWPVTKRVCGCGHKWSQMVTNGHNVVTRKSQLAAPTTGCGHTTVPWTAGRDKKLGTSGVAGRPSPPARRNPGDEAAAAPKQEPSPPDGRPRQTVTDTPRALGRPAATNS